MTPQARGSAVSPGRGMLLAFCVVVFGAYVRLTDAGLGCPDWPGLLRARDAGAAAPRPMPAPRAPLHVGKAWREMIHRYGASTLGLIIVVNAVLAFLWRPARPCTAGVCRWRWWCW